MSTFSTRLGITMAAGFTGAVAIGLLANSPVILGLGIVVLGLSMVAALSFYVLQLNGPVEEYDSESSPDLPPTEAWNERYQPPPRRTAKLFRFADYRRSRRDI